MVLLLDGNSEIGACVESYFDLFKAFDSIESSHKSELFLAGLTYFSHIMSYHLINASWSNHIEVGVKCYR